MKKIMLIDDRTERQTKFDEETSINLDKYSDVLDNFTADSYEELLDMKDDLRLYYWIINAIKAYKDNKIMDLHTINMDSDVMNIN